MAFPNMSVPIAQMSFCIISENTEYICNYEKDTNNRSLLYIDYKKIHSSPMILKQHRHRRDNNEKKL